MSYASEVLADSPLVYWKLDETSGTTAADSSATGTRAGTHNAGASPNASPLIVGSGRSVDYAGTGQSTFRSHEAWMNLSTLTAEAWVHLDGSPGSAGIHTVVAKESASSTNSQRAWALQVYADGTPTFAGRLTNSTVFSAAGSAGQIALNTTYHLVATFDGTTARIYVNGVLAGSASASGSMNTNTFALQVAKDSSGDTRSLNGRVDEFAMYSGALSDTRIATHYSEGIGGSTTVNLGLSSQSVTSYPVTADVVVPVGKATFTTTAQPITVLEGVSRNLATVHYDITAYGLTVDVDTVVELGPVAFDTTAYAIGVESASVVVNLPVVSFDMGAYSLSVDGGATGTSSDVTGGRLRDGVGYATWTPAVEPLPIAIASEKGVWYDVAFAFTPVVVNGTQPDFDTITSAVPRHRDRILVGGLDVTYFRGAEVRVGDYQLMEPLGYGTATLEFPQVYPEYEEIGAGDLSWLAPGKKVVIQRVDAAGNVVATDYKGYLIAPSANTGTFTYEVGGQVTGPAALRWRPMPLFRSTGDIGFYLAQALGFVGVRTTQRLGPDTGIEVARMGGMSLLEYMQALVGRAWTRDGNQWTAMPGDDGVYEIRRKDRTSIDGTVYLSASSASADLRRDISEEPNRIFATGVTPAGKRVRFGRYPGLDIREDGAPAFPGFLTEGDTGDGVLTLIQQLRVQGYLNAETAPGGYDNDVTKAVREVQDDADLPVTGNVNRTTWEAIFDNVAQGVSLRLARIEPAAQKRYTKRFRFSASGAIIGKNPYYDPTRLKIDREVDFGTGFTQPQMREWSKAELAEGGEPNWVGSLTIHSGAIVAGDHTPGDPIGAVLPARDIRAGMNLSLPQFQGGIVVHVTACRVNGDVVTLDVDTRARDAWTVAQIIERDRESRQDPARAFFRELVSSRVQKDAIEEWSEVGGLITQQALRGGEWNVVEVVAGQAGTVRSLRLETNPFAESAVAVFGKRIWPNVLQRLIGNPLTEAGSAKWSDEGVRRQLERDHGILYQAGDDVSPGGYSPGYKDPDGGPSIFTGKFEDDASFAYYTEHRPVLYVAVWVDTDTVLSGGRIMWPQLEAGA